MHYDDVDYREYSAYRERADFTTTIAIFILTIFYLIKDRYE